VINNTNLIQSLQDGNGDDGDGDGGPRTFVSTWHGTPTTLPQPDGNDMPTNPSLWCCRLALAKIEIDQLPQSKGMMVDAATIVGLTRHRHHCQRAH